ncbi:hypothetical protein Alsa4_CDS0180 [Staphylococcus phage Alsa_4]|nr:hypothetical protein Alsa4_CDS0180 [Staphylococcus phage Alsa_4]
MKAENRFKELLNILENNGKYFEHDCSYNSKVILLTSKHRSVKFRVEQIGVLNKEYKIFTDYGQESETELRYVNKCSNQKAVALVIINLLEHLDANWLFVELKEYDSKGTILHGRYKDFKYKFEYYFLDNIDNERELTLSYGDISESCKYSYVPFVSQIEKLENDLRDKIIAKHKESRSQRKITNGHTNIDPKKAILSKYVSDIIDLANDTEHSIVEMIREIKANNYKELLSAYGYVRPETQGNKQVYIFYDTLGLTKYKIEIQPEYDSSYFMEIDRNKDKVKKDFEIQSYQELKDVLDKYKPRWQLPSHILLNKEYESKEITGFENFINEHSLNEIMTYVYQYILKKGRDRPLDKPLSGWELNTKHIELLLQVYGYEKDNNECNEPQYVNTKENRTIRLYQGSNELFEIDKGNALGEYIGNSPESLQRYLNFNILKDRIRKVFSEQDREKYGIIETTPSDNALITFMLTDSDPSQIIVSVCRDKIIVKGYVQSVELTQDIDINYESVDGLRSTIDKLIWDMNCVVLIGTWCRNYKIKNESRLQVNTHMCVRKGNCHVELTVNNHKYLLYPNWTDKNIYINDITMNDNNTWFSDLHEYSLVETLNKITNNHTPHEQLLIDKVKELGYEVIKKY